MRILFLIFSWCFCNKLSFTISCSCWTHFFQSFSVFLLYFNKISCKTSGEFICFNISLLFCWHYLSFHCFLLALSAKVFFFLSFSFLYPFSFSVLLFCSGIMLLYFFVLSWADIGVIFIFLFNTKSDKKSLLM